MEVAAEVQASPAFIKLKWKPDPAAGSYDVYRWSKGSSLGNAVLLANLGNAGGTRQEYVDNTALVGGAYEYRVRKILGSAAAQGYLLAGINVAPTERRGTLVLLVDNTHAAYLAPDLEQLQADLVGDGWVVLRHDVAPTLSPPQVRALIQNDYQADPTQVQAVFILGHVAVPYSGALNPDAHPDHYGAWPADVYYGDMTSTWTDSQVHTISAGRPENRNVVGDGKFDQSTLPRAPQLMVGRVDLSRLPAFTLPERDLLRRYLLKDHQFRHKQWNVTERGLVDDHFGLSTGEAFANNGWSNFAPMFGIGPNAVVAAPYFSSTRTASYLWSYACGPAGFTGVGGVGSTADFASGPVQCVFNMQFGSYFGDWDNPNNFMRATLAAEGYTLASCWAGRPDWAFHFMGLGETLGYCTRRSQPANDFGSGGEGTNGVHTALMGDPTLRLHPLAPATDLVASAAAGAAVLSWTGSADASEGYYVYRARTPAGPFFRITAQAVTAGTTYTDPAPLPGNSSYMVRAVKLLTTASGSYFNLSQGSTATFAAPAPPAAGGNWLGTLSADWHTPGNWSSGAVPTSTSEAVLPAGTLFAPVVSGPAAVAQLTLAPQARLTVAAGGRLRVSLQPVVQGAPAGAPATTIVLAAGSATLPGGQLKVLDHSSGPQAGLRLETGTALQVGSDAALHLLGSLHTTGSALSYAASGRLVFEHDSASFSPQAQHIISGTPAITVGILSVGDSRATLGLSGPVQVLSQVENRGHIIINNALTLRSTPGQQAILVPLVPGPGQARSMGRYTGNVTVQVYVDGSRNAGLGYRHLSPPVTGALVTSARLANGTFTPVINRNYNTIGPTVTPFPTVFFYDQQYVSAQPWAPTPRFDNGWRSPNAPGTSLMPGRGLTVNMPGNTTLSFTGVVRNTPLANFGLYRDSTDVSGWHFFGNPYAAPLDWDLLAGDTTSLEGVSRALYVFKSSGQYTGTYASYLPGTPGNPGIGINGGGPIVPVGQGFFVRTARPDDAGSLRFSLDQLQTTPAVPPVQRSTADTRPRLLLALRDATGSQRHETLVYFQAGATAGPDAAYDAAALPSSEQPLSLHSFTLGSAYGINGLPALTGADVVVPLRLRAAASGTYQLRAETLANLPPGYHAYLRDAVAGHYTDLAAAPATALVLVANTLVTRYEVLFTTRTSVLAASEAVAELVSLYPNPAQGRATLLLPQGLRGAASADVKILNTMGQLLPPGRCQASDEGVDISLAGLAPGVYIIQVMTATGPVSRRLVVR